MTPPPAPRWQRRGALCVRRGVLDGEQEGAGKVVQCLALRLCGRELGPERSNLAFVLASGLDELIPNANDFGAQVSDQCALGTVRIAHLGFELCDATFGGAASVLKVVGALQGVKELELERRHLLALGHLGKKLGDLPEFEDDGWLGLHDMSFRSVCGEGGVSAHGGRSRGRP
jgi:hypothetical protein